MVDIPTSGLTDRQLKWSYWYVTHKLAIRKWVAVFLVVLAVGFWFFNIWQAAEYINDYNQRLAIVNRLLYSGDDNLGRIESTGPQALNFSGLDVIKADNGRYDALIRVVNPNRDWGAKFDYRFVDSSEKLSGFVLPGGDKFLMGLGLTQAPGEIKIENLRWIKVADFDKYNAVNKQIAISEEDLVAGTSPADPNKVTFTATNNSAYSYWQAGFQVFLYSGQQLVSFNYFSVDKLLSGETRKIDLNWNSRLPRINNIEVVADVNLLDQENIIPPSAPPSVM